MKVSKFIRWEHEPDSDPLTGFIWGGEGWVECPWCEEFCIVDMDDGKDICKHLKGWDYEFAEFEGPESIDSN